MKLEHGVTLSSDSFKDKPWNVVGHTYTPKLLSDNAFVWHAVLPADTFVPPHIHTTQDEWISVLSGQLEVEFGSEKLVANAGDLVRMPMNEPHGIFNRSGAEATARVTATHVTHADAPITVRSGRTAAGRWESELALRHSGRWELHVEIVRGDDRFTSLITRQIVLQRRGP